MPDAVATFSSEYIYVSDRLVGDIVDQLDAASSRRETGAVQIRPPFLAVESRLRDLGVNRYAQAARATDAVADLTGSFAYPGPFVLGLARVSWWDLKITERPTVRVAWLVARQEGDEGRFLVAMCGSLEHFVGYRADTNEPAGWRPSALPGLANVLKAFDHRSGRKWKINAEPTTSEDAAKEMLLEAAHVSMVLDEDSDSPIGVGRMEVLARIFYAMRGAIRLRNYRTQETEVFDGLYLGTPLWIRTPPEVHAPDEGSALGYGGMRVIEIGPQAGGGEAS